MGERLSYRVSRGRGALKHKPDTMKQTDLLQGTLDMLILRVLSRGEIHGWGIADRIEQVSGKVLSVGEGSLYPALYRLQEQGWIESEWGVSENNRKAKFYRLTKAGRKQLEMEKQSWERLTTAIGAILRSA
jgi:PadR family transcriptional regulator, regulatory protein PadR